MPTIDHIGVVVDDIGEAKTFLTEVLGLELEKEADYPDLGVRSAFFLAGPVRIEINEVMDADTRRTRLGVDGTQARIEHIAIVVDNLDDWLRKLNARGVRTVPPQVPAVRTGRTSVRTVPETTDGVMYQIIEVP
jgi:methylmalonyl-CoA/ethylmalonyl-CoA epimerase